MIELIDYTDDMFDFVLDSNNINKPQVGFLKSERLELLINQANYCKVAKFKGEFAGFLLCLPESQEYDSLNYQWVSKRFSNFVYIDRISVLPKFQNEKIGSGSIITEYKTSPIEIVKATVMHDSPPDLLIQFSGGFAISRKEEEVVPLEEGDTVQISLENVGYIQNEVEIV